MDAQGIEDLLRTARRNPEAGSRMFDPVNMAQPAVLVMEEPVGLKELKSRDDCNVALDPSCNKSVTSNTYILPIALAIIIPVVGISVALIFLHRRHVRKQRAEDAADRHASLDFGLGEVHRKKKNEKGGLTIVPSDYDSEKHNRQLSMDMVSPYLLPPELQNSRESLHSLSRAGQDAQDPYRPVAQYLEETGSLRSFKPHDASSIMTASSGPSRLRDNATANLLGNAQRMSRTDPPVGFVPPPRLNSLAPAPTGPLPQTPGSHGPVEAPAAPVIQMPAPVAAPVPRKGLSGLPDNPRPDAAFGLTPSSSTEQDEQRGSYMGGDSAAIRNSNNYLGNYINRDGSPAPAAQANKGPQPLAMPELTSEPLSIELPSDSAPRNLQTSPPPSIPLPANPRPERKQSLPVAQQAVIEDADATSDYGDGFKVTPPSPGRDEYARGQRYSMDVPPEEFAQAGLGAPGFDARRLSMTFRPLPPDSLTADVEDPETRANRIRSFYKEYFDDSKPAPQGQYYEDYDENYLGDAAYYDPDTNNFVMPYAEPVTRRAMTPPPQSQRFMGQQGPPRPFMGQEGRPRPRNGSMGGLPMGGGPRFMPPGGGPRSYSSASNRGPPGPRAMSSASGRMGPPRGRPLPPPEALNSLPAPSKLRDDSFALMGAIEFAPPVTYRDRQNGRSESPFGERRPYSPSVPSHRPLVGAFDELAPIPSPHLLRNSKTFTSLDFAPPRKIFRDDGSASDAGSIRSNRSGVSRMGNDAIRKGAYRVSRIPQEGTSAVPTKDAMSDILKPSWGMRQGS